MGGGITPPSNIHSRVGNSWAKPPISSLNWSLLVKKSCFDFIFLNNAMSYFVSTGHILSLLSLILLLLYVIYDIFLFGQWYLLVGQSFTKSIKLVKIVDIPPPSPRNWLVQGPSLFISMQLLYASSALATRYL